MKLQPGRRYPLGATFDGAGTNFSLFSELAEKVELCLFDDAGKETRVDLPEENSQAIFARVKTQREQEARRIRAEGAKDAQVVRAEADKQQRVILAEAQRKSEILRGEGDAESTRIYAGAYGQDPEFFDFWRSLQAMTRALTGNTTALVGSPEGAFFRYFGEIPGKQEPGKESPKPTSAAPQQASDGTTAP